MVNGEWAKAIGKLGYKMTIGKCSLKNEYCLLHIIGGLFLIVSLDNNRGYN